MLLGITPLKQTMPDDPKKGECKKVDWRVLGDLFYDCIYSHLLYDYTY